jgi:uncharacterized OsmC-like protein
MTKTVIYPEKNLSTRCIHESGAEIKTSAPKDNQGTGDLFSPTDLVGVALGSCMLTLMEIAAKRKNLDLSSMKVEVEKEMSTKPPRRVAKITIHFYSKDAFDEASRKLLETAAKTCPVHESLHPDIIQDIHFHWGNG